ncbi:MAG: LysM peptidoglycan-binding domain-containing protein [Actinomycetaceae bacterium]|nr:LysM peptidoglycan-binding domain-containing protein [Actinomycetaceae bacterium]
MSQSFAPWVDGSTALDLSQLEPAKKLPHLRVVPSAPECVENDEQVEDYAAPQQKNYEGILLFAIKALSVLVLLCCIAIAGLGIGFLLSDTPEAIIVQSGDSLYSIGASLSDAPSPAQAAADIRSLNALDSDVLYAGQKLILPQY